MVLIPVVDGTVGWTVVRDLEGPSVPIGGGVTTIGTEFVAFVSFLGPTEAENVAGELVAMESELPFFSGTGVCGGLSVPAKLSLPAKRCWLLFVSVPSML